MTENKKELGGKRKGAGRPKGSGMYGEPTQLIRVPVSLVQEVKDYILLKLLQRPITSSGIIVLNGLLKQLTNKQTQ